MRLSHLHESGLAKLDARARVDKNFAMALSVSWRSTIRALHWLTSEEKEALITLPVPNPALPFTLDPFKSQRPGSPNKQNGAVLQGLMTGRPVASSSAVGSQTPFSSNWEPVTTQSILRGLPSQPIWHSGCIRDVLLTATDRLLVATDTGGVWLVAGDATRCLTDDWLKPDLVCLAPGLSGDHVFAGGAALHQTDITASDPLTRWIDIAPLPANDLHQPVTSVNSILCVGTNIVIATDVGIFWAPIVTGGSFTWKQATANIPFRGGTPNSPNAPLRSECYSLAHARVGSTDYVLAGGGDPALPNTLIMRGTFLGSDLVMSGATIYDSSGNTILPGSWPRIAVCAGVPNVAYATTSDESDLRFSMCTVLRSLDAGATWHPCGPVVANSPRQEDLFSAWTYKVASGAGAGGGRPNGCICVHPDDPDVVVCGWQNGPFISTNGAQLFTIGKFAAATEYQWYDVGVDGDPAFHLQHGDLHAVRFIAPRTVGGPNAVPTLVVCSDGGLLQCTADLRGDPTQLTWSTDLNRYLLTLQFLPHSGGMWNGQLTAGTAVSGLIAGTTLDNGAIYAARVPGRSYWTQTTAGDSYGDVNDGTIATLLPPNSSWRGMLSQQLLIFQFVGGHDDSWHATWDASPGTQKFTNYDLCARSNIDVIVQGVSPVHTPKTGAGALLATAYDENALHPGHPLLGLFGDSTSLAWKWLANAPEGVASCASFDGSTILVGGASGRTYSYDTSSGRFTAIPVESAITKPYPNGTVDWIIFDEDGNAFGLYNGSSPAQSSPSSSGAEFGVVVQLESSGGLGGARHSPVWTDLSRGQLPVEWLYGLAVSPLDGRLFVATDSTVYSLAADRSQWVSVSAGLPACPHCSALCIGRDPSGLAWLYLSTYGRSAWMMLLGG
jgi:hypothetical protein